MIRLSIVATLAFLLSFYLAAVSCNTLSEVSDGKPLDITMSNWTMVLEGEWLIEFYAPWCPSCRSYATIWEEFARKCPKHVKVARANVDTSPEMSGRLLIVALPTIYHVKNGKFRHHEGSRNLEEMLRHVNERLFEETYEPLSWVWHPQSPHMMILGFLFRVAVEVRNLQNYLTNTLGLAPWLSYVVLLMIMMVIAIALGFICVVIADRFWNRNNEHDEAHLRSPTPTTDEECDDEDDGYKYRKNNGRHHNRRHHRRQSNESDTAETNSGSEETDDGDYEVRKRRTNDAA